MGKYAALFVFVGLALGLWLGFNPAAHRAVVRWWRDTRNGNVTQTTAHAPDLRRLDSQANRLLRNAQAARPAPLITQPEPRDTVPSGMQIGQELQAFWNALGRIWRSVVGRIANGG